MGRKRALALEGLEGLESLSCFACLGFSLWFHLFANIGAFWFGQPFDNTFDAFANIPFLADPIFFA